MADKSRERNYVDLFSDYGLDERQKAIQNKIMTKCFKLMFYSVFVLTVVWLELCFFLQIEISNSVIALSYFILVIICQSVYAVTASKHGVINGITATSNSSAIVIIMFVVSIPIFAVTIKNGSSFTEERLAIIVFFGICIINSVIQYLCGKRNFKTLDQQGREDSEEE